MAMARTHPEESRKEHYETVSTVEPPRQEEKTTFEHLEKSLTGRHAEDRLHLDRKVASA